jgi:hypothetical protein
MMTIHTLYYDMLNTDRLYEAALEVEYGSDALAMRYRLEEQPVHTRKLGEEKDRAYKAFISAMAEEGAYDGFISALPKSAARQ